MRQQKQDHIDKCSLKLLIKYAQNVALQLTKKKLYLKKNQKKSLF